MRNLSLKDGPWVMSLESSVVLEHKDKKVINASLKELMSVIAKSLLKETKLLIKAETIAFDVHLCGESKMKSLNNKHRGKNKVTDVLSFPVHDDLREIKAWSENENYLHLGDIFICYNMAKKQGEEFQISTIHEIIHLLIHGLLHLIGFDHEVSREEEEIMQKYEDVLVEKFIKRAKK